MLSLSPTSHFPILALLFIAVLIGIVGEERRWFGNISGVLTTIIIAAIFTSVGMLPSGSDPALSVPVYQFAFTYLIPYSIPLLLFNIELKRIFRESGKLMLVFLIGALGVMAGALLAGWLLDLGEETYKLAAVYTATYTGGSVNFMAVASTFDFLESPLFAASIVVDNVFTVLFIIALFLLPKLAFLQAYFPKADKSDVVDAPKEISQQKGLLEQLAVVLSISAILVAIGKWLAPMLESALQTDLQLDILLITLLILILANLIPRFLRQFEQVAFQLGMYLLYFFLAVIGATCDLRSMLTASPKVLLFAIITLAVHLVVLLLAGRLLKFSLEDMAIASGANVGGVSISAPMAAAFEMKKAVTPAILVGIMGYIVGTFMGIGVGLLLK